MKKILILLSILAVAGAFTYFVLNNDEVEKPEEEIEEVEKPEEEEKIEEENNVSSDIEETSFISCLKEEGVVIYGSRTCPYCVQLVKAFEDYDDFYNIYIDCVDEGQICNENNVRAYPEVRIKGETIRGGRTPEALSELTNCEL